MHACQDVGVQTEGSQVIFADGPPGDQRLREYLPHKGVWAEAAVEVIVSQ